MAAAVVLSDTLVNSRAHGHRDPVGAYPVVVSFPVATTQIDDTDDKTIFYEFPAKTLLWAARVTSTDIDTATGLVWDLSTATATDGTVGTVLINDSTVGRSAGSEGLESVDLGGVDVSDTYLMYHVATGATTPAAGTITVRMLLSPAPPTIVGVSSVSSTRLAAPGEEVL